MKGYNWLRFYEAFAAPSRFAGVHREQLRDVEPSILDAIDQWIVAYSAKVPSNGLLLFGQSGVGKTILACYVLAQLLRPTHHHPRGRILSRAAFTTGTRLAAEISASMGHEHGLSGLYDFYILCDLLILDNIVPMSLDQHGWLAVHIAHIISERFNNGSASILTSTFDPDRVIQWLGPSGGVLTEACLPIHLEGRAQSRWAKD